VELGPIVYGSPDVARESLVEMAEGGDELHEAVLEDPMCQALFAALWQNYVLFAVLEPGGPNRRILKYSYGDEFDLSERRINSLDPSEIIERAWRPDRRAFFIDCPGAWRAASFHVEIAIPSELRIRDAVLWDLDLETPLGDWDHDVNRAALYADTEAQDLHDIQAYVEVSPERAGHSLQAAMIASAVAALLWAGALSGLDATNPGPAVSILLAGAALFSGVSANLGEHRLVRMIYKTGRRLLTTVALMALIGSVSLAMEIPDQHPVCVWTAAAVVSSLAAARLSWSAFRASA